MRWEERESREEIGWEGGVVGKRKEKEEREQE